MKQWVIAISDSDSKLLSLFLSRRGIDSLNLLILIRRCYMLLQSIILDFCPCNTGLFDTLLNIRRIKRDVVQIYNNLSNQLVYTFSAYQHTFIIIEVYTSLFLYTSLVKYAVNLLKV